VQLGNCTQNQDFTLHCGVRCLPVFQSDMARLTLGLSSGDVLYWQGFTVQQNGRLLAGWSYVLSVDGFFISGRNCQRLLLSLGKGLERTS